MLIDLSLPLINVLKDIQLSKKQEWFISPILLMFTLIEITIK